PGNVRELEHIIERLVITSVSDTITEELISTLNNETTSSLEEIPENMTLKEVMDNYERKLLTWALLKYGSTRKVGRALGIEQSTVAKKIKRLKINVD
ncbi:MAG TPA: PAS domain S-box protein, partial [Clostridiales bacterium]|nr:PAS domain S-box protein [Clostridiales bacterium]